MQESNPERSNRAETTRARRALLVDAAITCFVESGIARTGMRDIATKAGVSVGNLYNHFPGRDDLITEIAHLETAGLNTVLAKTARCTAPQDRIDSFVHSYFTHCADPVSAILTIEITSEALRNPAVERLFSGNRTKLVNILAAAIEDLGHTPPRAREIAGLVIDTIEGFALRVGLAGRKARKRDIETVMAFARQAVHP